MERAYEIDDDAPEMSKQREHATNYFRLVQLLMIEGTIVVRKTILSRLRQRKTLHTILADRRPEFIQKGSGFNRQQLDVLYPTSGNADLAKIDMTLWFALARKLHVIPKKYMEDLHADGAGDPNNALLATQVEWCQDLATIHAIRNNLFHLVTPEMETEIFDDQWNILSEALRRLDPGLDPEDFQRYRTADLNPKAVVELRAMIREQCLDERCEDLADEVRKRNRIIHLILLVVALVLVLILVAVLLFVILFRQPRTCDQYLQYRVIGNLAGLYFLPRNGWGAVPPSAPLDPLVLPVPNIIYTHTAEISQCSVTQECCNQVKNIQYLHMNQRKPDKFFDIGYHYLIDNKGVIYEGRNISQKPSAVRGWNHNITSVAFIGNFMYQSPTVETLGAFDLLIAYLKFNNFIISNYTIYGMCECRVTDSPGRILYKAISESKLNHINGHVRYRNESNCFFNGTAAADDYLEDQALWVRPSIDFQLE